MRAPFRLFISLAGLALIVLAGCATRAKPAPEPPPPRHALVGSWLARDDTVFVFRDDGTFVGVDVRRREIWGNWVTLDAARIGFQSLMHDASYRPQYAVISAENPARMDYIVTGGTHFIPALRIGPDEAARRVAEALAGKIVLP